MKAQTYKAINDSTEREERWVGLEGMKRGRFLAVFVVLTFFAQFMVYAYGIPQKGTLLCGRSVNPVAVDGKWTSASEWVDSAEEKIVSDTKTVYIRIKHDNEYIYVLLDFVTDSVIEYAEQMTPEKPYDGAAIVLDTNDDGGGAPHIDDYLFGVRWNSPTTYFQMTRKGTGSGWSDWLPNPEGFIGASSMDSSNDPYNPSPHLIYELRVPIFYIGQKTVYGAGIFATDGFPPTLANLFFIGWPHPSILADLMNPNGWGDLNMTETIIPEFPAGAFSIATIAVASALILLRVKKPREIPR
nr:hypothetical protein [Candidatus Njordarchaeum guaymaensis]